MPTGRSVGRPSKPVERHRLAGNPSKKALPAVPLPGEGVSVSAGVPDCPSGLDEYGAVLWGRTWDAGRAWLSPESDAQLVRDLCCVAQEAETLRCDIESGVVPRWYETSHGQVNPHPAVKQLNEYRSQLVTRWSMLGFSPSDRARLGLAQVRIRDELDGLIQRRAERVRGWEAQRVEAAAASESD
jgi:P27 family predicted phage terminase small subunit